jgi:large subunit ribosomal protein L6e
MPKPSTGHKFMGRGIPEKSRSESYHSKGLWALKAKNAGKFPAGKAAVPQKPRRVLVEKTVKVRRGPNKGKERKVQRLVPRVPRTFVNQPDAVRSKHTRRTNRLPTQRKSIVPGRVAIVLEGKHRGKRVVIVKALQSGLVVVTGPASLNTVPLRRMSPAYLIATSVKLDFKTIAAALPKEQSLNAVDDKFFERERSKHIKLAKQQLTADEKKARTEKKLARRKEESEKPGGRKLNIVLKTPRTSVATKKSTRRPGSVQKVKELTEKQKTRKALQKALDKALTKEVKKTPLLEGYLRSQFQLTSGQYPHELKF